MKRSIVAALALLAVPAGAADVPTGFTDSVHATGLSSPVSMTFAPDGRLFVCEKNGNLRIVSASGSLLTTPFLSLPVESGGERGLLGVAFHPQFASNGFLYVYHTVSLPVPHNRISRFTADGDTVLAGSEMPILDLDAAPGMYHNGGALHFGPDGRLYVAVGDGGPSSNGQLLSNRFGKILRIEPDGSIPADNPASIAGLGPTSGPNRSIWSAGLRNPFTFAIQPGTGRVFVNDVGAASREEVNEILPGANYGWPTTEGDFAQPSYPSFTRPLVAYPHDSGLLGTDAGEAITGAVFYPASGPFPSSYHGQYFFADLTNRWIRTLDPAGLQVAVFATDVNGPIDLDVGPDGALYVLEYAGGAAGQGRIRRIAYTAGTPPSIALPPADASVPAGRPASFTVGAAGSAPLAFQWQRDGADLPGETSDTLSIPSVQAADDGARFRCRVSNAFGSVVSLEALLAVPPGMPPTATITSPASYAAGEQIAFSGSASDPEDGPLPASAFSWRVDFHHATHVHPFLPDQAGSPAGVFTVPLSGETATDVGYRILLTVTDSSGLSTTTARHVLPRLSSFTLRTIPPGLQLTLDGTPVPDGTLVDGVVGQVRTLRAAPPPGYRFDSWSDGGSESHDIATPAAPEEFVARFEAEPPAGNEGSGSSCGLLGAEVLLLLIFLHGCRRIPRTEPPRRK